MLSVGGARESYSLFRRGLWPQIRPSPCRCFVQLSSVEFDLVEGVVDFGPVVGAHHEYEERNSASGAGKIARIGRGGARQVGFAAFWGRCSGGHGYRD